MIVAFDNTFLTLVINPSARPRPNPATGEPVRYCEQRIEALIDRISRAGNQVIIPTPSLAEALCASKDVELVIERLKGYSSIEVVPFDARSAVELAQIVRASVVSGDKRSGVAASWQEVKFDRQIVAIAKAHGASVLYTDDSNQTKFATLADLQVVHTWDLDLPDRFAQMPLLGTD